MLIITVHNKSIKLKSSVQMLFLDELGCSLTTKYSILIYSLLNP